jgi:probable HAF family extracellular repeat protein
LAPGLTQAQYRFTKIDVPQATLTEANGNSTEEIVGDFNQGNKKKHGFVLNNGVFTTIDVPGAAATSINGVNELGQLAGTYFDGMFHAFFESNGSFTTLDPPGSIQTAGGFINLQGQVVGTYKDANKRRHGFIWSNGTFTTFSVPGDGPGFGTRAFGINDFGEVVGDYGTGQVPFHGFLRSSTGDFTTFDVPGVVQTTGEGINNAGTIVGFYIVEVQGPPHGFVLKNGVFMTVDVPDKKGNTQPTQIFSINANEEIVGTYFASDGMQHGFLGVPASATAP